MQYTARPSLCARTVSALALPCVCVFEFRKILFPQFALAEEQHGGFRKGPT